MAYQGEVPPAGDVHDGEAAQALRAVIPAVVAKASRPDVVAPARSASPVAAPRGRYQHGTLASYTHGACRCDDCRRVNTLYHRELRRRLRARIGTPEAQVPHGTAGGYANHGCRCRGCSRAHQEAMSHAYLRRRAALGA